MHDLLLQHSDGTFQLVVWGERLSGQDRVTVRFGALTSVKIYDPTIGVEPVDTLTNVSSLELTLSDHPIVLAISSVKAMRRHGLILAVDESRVSAGLARAISPRLKRQKCYPSSTVIQRP